MLGTPVLLGYGLASPLKLAFYGVAVPDCAMLSLIPGLLESRLARHTTEVGRGEVFGLNQAFQSLASVAAAEIFVGLLLLNLCLP